MLQYKEYVLNESRTNTLSVGDIVIFTKNYTKYTCRGKVAIIEEIEGKDYTLKMQPQYDKQNIGGWMAFETVHKFDFVDVIKLSRNQVAKAAIIDKDNFKLWKKGHLIFFQCSNIFQRILDYMEFEIKLPFVDTPYIDVEENSNTGVTYLPIAKYKSEIEKGDMEALYKVKGRQTMRVSKILKKLDPSLNESELEGFVAKYKVAYKNLVDNASERVKVVTGEKIRYWYLGSRYAKDRWGNSGSLGNSCMRYKKSQKRCDIYCENPDKCAMAIYLDEKGDLLARALIWHLDDGTVYMDRIYHVSVEDRLQLMDYAKKMKMKSYDSGDGEKEKMIITLKKDYGSPEDNPYMDTFKWFDSNDTQLFNYLSVKRDKYQQALQSYKVYNDHD